jgi:hypothetical protein
VVESSTPELIRIRRKAGFVLKHSAKGDHQMWWHPGSGIQVTVDGKVKSRHSANVVLEQAKLPKAF